MKRLILFVFLIGISSINAQTKEEVETKKAELETKKTEKQAIAKAAKAEADALQAEIDALPGWRIGAFGTIGGSLSSFNNWYSQGTPNNASGNIGFTLNGYANLIQKKYFWRNSLSTNLNWIKLDNKDISTDDEDFNPTTDVFNITSLYGRNITKTLSASGLLEYRTTLLDNFNDPGYLDIGIGATWTPIENLIVVIHPLNYNFIFAKNDAVFESSLGAKIVADYTRQIGAINFKTNLSVFQSYKSSDLSNYTWTNSFSYTLWKMIGVGFDFGLRSNKQETLNFATKNHEKVVAAAAASTPPTTVTAATPSFDNIEDDLQSYWRFGLSYKF